jgi:hypothetical protein
MDLAKGWTYEFDRPYEEVDPERDRLGRFVLRPIEVQEDVFNEEDDLLQVEINEDGYVADVWKALEDIQPHSIPDVLGVVGRVNTNHGLLPCLNCLFYGFMPEHFERCENCDFLPEGIVLEDYILKTGTWTWSSLECRENSYEDPWNPGEEYSDAAYNDPYNFGDGYDDCDFPYNNRRRELFPEPGLEDRDYWSDDYNDNESI